MAELILTDEGEKVNDIRYQEQCASCDCDIWIKDGVRHLICPHCGAKLNEYSSEDADEGKHEEETE